MASITQAFPLITPALLRLPAVCILVGLSKSQIYRLIRAGEFPSAVQIGSNSVAWPGVLQGSCRVSRFFMQPFSVPVAPSRGSV
jgi:predicted DNA-binding transcriptional regulator AlpA